MDVQSYQQSSRSDTDESLSPCLPSHVRKPPADAAERLRALLIESAKENPEDDVKDFAAFRKAINESRSDGRKLYQ